MLLVGCAMSLCIFGMHVFADTVSYDITVNSTATNQDNLSKKVKKNTDGDNYFYVTPTYFDSGNASFWATSMEKYGDAYSERAYVENGINETRETRYATDAPGGVYYFMLTEYGYSATGSVNSKGRYTP